MRVLVVVLLAASLSQGLRVTEFDNRFEGLTRWDVASPDFELVSFTRRFDPFVPGDTLKVSFHHPPGAVPEVLAQELVLNKGYVMRSKAQRKWVPGGTSALDGWPTNVVLDPERLGPDLIGVVVKAGEVDRSPRYVPADVVSSKVKPAAASDDGLLLKFRRRGRLKAVRFLLLSVTKDGGREHVKDWRTELSSAEMLGGGVIVTRLGPTTPSGELELQLSGEVQNSNRPTLAKIRIVIPKTWKP